MSLIYSFFKLTAKQEKLYDNSILPLFGSQEDLKKSKKIKKKIRKLNEFQFFQICLEIFYDHSLKHWNLSDLQLFFELKTDFQYRDNNSFDSKGNPNEMIKVDRITFNCSYELQSLVDYLINAEEYSPINHLRKLFALSNIISESFFQQIDSIRCYFENYIDEIEENNFDDKICYYSMIIDALNSFDEELYLMLDDISLKINELSKSKFDDSYKSYGLKINDSVLRELYKELERNEFIDIEKTSEKDFCKVLTSNWNKHHSVVYMEMDNIQFKLFLDCIDEVLKIKIPLTKIELAKNIKNKNGFIKASSVYASKSKSKMPPKDAELIKNIIQMVEKG